METSLQSSRVTFVHDWITLRVGAGGSGEKVIRAFSSLWVAAKDLGGVLGLEVRQRLLLPWPRTVKRVTDVVAGCDGSVSTGFRRSGTFSSAR
jgi:hypothetical protein